jgi:Rod binding domain-containing protein
MDSFGAALVPVTSLGPAPESLAVQPHAGDHRSMDSVATNFESMFLSLMLKQMRQTLEPGGLFAQDSGDVFGGLFDLYLGQHLAQSGGLGIGTMLKRQLETAKQT